MKKLLILIGVLIFSQFAFSASDDEWKIQKQLFDAIVKDDIKTMETILKDNPSFVKKEIKYHNFPVLDAALSGSLKALKLLVEKGADINTVDGKTGNNVLHMLVKSKPKEDKLEQALTYLINEKKMKLETKNEFGKTPFIYAFSYSSFAPPSRQNIPIIKVFAKYGADLNAQDKEGKTALYYLVSGFNSPTKIDLVKECESAILLANQKGVDVNITDNDKRTPLIAFLLNTKSAEDKQKIPMVTCLMENGAKTNIKSKKKETALKLVDKKSELYQIMKKTKAKKK